MDLILVAIVTGVAGIVGGLIGAFAKPYAEDRVLQGKERRERRQEFLRSLDDALYHAIDHPLPQSARTSVAAIGDHMMSEYVGRIFVEPNAQARQDAIGNARHRLGELMR